MARVLALVDVRCGSVLESLLRVLLHVHGVRAPRTQVLVRARDGSAIGRVDFAWPDVRLVVEADGFAFHADRASYREDRRRTQVLTRHGCAWLRSTYEDVVRSRGDLAGQVLQAWSRGRSPGFRSLRAP